MKDQIIIICSKIKWHFSLLLIKNGSCWSIIDNKILIYDRPKKLNTATLNASIRLQFKKALNILEEKQTFKEYYKNKKN
jgi:hypothetical protein